MQYLIVFISLILSTFSHATILDLEKQIYDVDVGKAGEATLIFLKDGKVIHTKNISEIKNALRFLSEKKSKMHLFSPISEETYEPTILQSLDDARKLFLTSQYVDKESQCYNRAHVWTYEWYSNYFINSNKTWLFFTRKYIRKFKFEWWFHVSPSVKVLEGEVAKEKIMDVKYSRGPLDLRTWTDIFMRNDAPCPRVKTYSDYANYPESSWCFTMRTSMYYYQPADIEAKETWDIIREEWNVLDLKAAYEEAFDRTN
jgi:Glutaminase